MQIVRNGMRSVAYGRGESNSLDMRMTSNADVQKGDVLVTSGIDGIYPAGLAVAKVTQIDSGAATPFETILCEPVAGINRNRQLLILLIATDNLPRPDNEEVRTKKEKINRKITREGVKDSAAVTVPAVAPTASPTASPVPVAPPKVAATPRICTLSR